MMNGMNMEQGTIPCHIDGCDYFATGWCNQCEQPTCGAHCNQDVYWCVKCVEESANKELKKDRLIADEVEATARAQNILAKAAKIVDGKRQQDYGSPAESFLKVAAAWSVILGKSVTPRAVCQCMIALKLVRDAHSPKEDNLIDIAGYARVMEMIEKDSHGF